MIKSVTELRTVEVVPTLSNSSRVKDRADRAGNAVDVTGRANSSFKALGDAGLWLLVD